MGTFRAQTGSQLGGKKNITGLSSQLGATAREPLGERAKRVGRVPPVGLASVFWTEADPRPPPVGLCVCPHTTQKAEPWESGASG